MELLLSIVIPTKNRHYYLKNIIDLFLLYDLQRTELVISDNSDQRLNVPRDGRIVYNYYSGNLSVDENTDLALDLAKGEYVLFLGDDDGFLPEVEQECLLMSAKNIKNLYGPTPVYFWPGLGLKGDYGANTGVLRSLPVGKKSIEVRNTRKALIKTLEFAGTRIEFLPRVYHGITSRQVLQNIKDDHGRYCLGPSPDMALSVAVCGYIESHSITNVPFVISGKCNASTGAKGIRGKHSGDLLKVSHLNRKFVENWPSEIPKYWTGPTVWAASLLFAAKEVRLSVKDFNKASLQGKLIVYNSPELKNLFKHSWIALTTIYAVTWWIIFRLVNALKNKRKYDLIVDNLITITHASKVLQDYLANANRK